jgi:hypothetical protein
MVVWWFVVVVDYAYPCVCVRERERKRDTREQSVKMTFRFWFFIKIHHIFGQETIRFSFVFCHHFAVGQFLKAAKGSK